MIPAERIEVTVESSLLASIGYSADATLDLAFRGGAVYSYSGVPPAIVFGLLTAPSKGGYFSRFIRGRFAYRRLR